MFPELSGICVQSAAPRGGLFIERAGRGYLAFDVTQDAGLPIAPRIRGRIARLAQVGLPGFPRLTAFVESDAACFAVLDVSAAPTLASILAERQLGDGELVDLACDLGVALGALHEVGEVYGELSTATVIAHAGSWRFTDYGDWGVRGDGAEPSSRRTHKAEDWTWADDLASLGRLLTECLKEANADTFARAQAQRLSLTLIGARTQDRAPSAHSLVAEFRSSVGLPNPPVRSRAVIGRREELLRLRQFASNPDLPRAAIIRGVPGIGKTHLVQGFLAEVDDIHVVRAGCRQWNASFCDVITQLVEAWVCNPDGSPRASGAAEVRRLVSELDQLFRPLSNRLRSAISAGNTRVPNDLSEDVYIDGLVEAIGRLLRSKTTLVVIEDVQWMDEASRKVLRRVIDTADYPVLLLLTARSDLDESVQAQRFLGALQSIVVLDHELAPLSAIQSSELAAHYLRVLPLASEQAHALGVLGDGTPLGVLEVVRFVLDAGLLVPDWERWKLDVAKVAELRLPTETIQLIAQRVRRLRSDAVEQLQIAAILGTRFEVSLLCVVSRASSSQVSAMLADAQRCELIEASDGECYRFVHQSVCDALTAGLESSKLQSAHARALTGLCLHAGSDLDQLDSERVYRAAHHASLAGTAAPRALAFAALLEAGRRASCSFDNARALELLSRADALGTDDATLSNALSVLIGEVHLRLGDLPSSLTRFRAIIDQQQTAEQLARVWSRIAWIHENEFDSETAWSALGQAFRCLDEPFPQSKVPVLFRVPQLLASTPLTNAAPTIHGQERSRAELLCLLLFQLARLALARSQLGPLLDAAGRVRELVTQLRSPAALSRVNNVFAFVQTIFGRKAAAQAFAREALQIAEHQGDPLEQSHSLTVGTALAIWRDEIDRGMRLGQLHITRFRNWMSPQDIAVTALNIGLIEGARGRVREAWPWLEQAAERALQYEGVVPVVPEVHYLMCRAAAIHLGIDDERAQWLERVRAACCPVPETSAFYLWSLGARVQVLTEAGPGGEEFERLIERVDALKLNPKRVHLTVTAYYIGLSHALIYEYLRAPQAQRAGKLVRLARASKELAAAARLGLLRAHAKVVRGFLLLFRGRANAAERLFAEAERIARRHDVPWVLYAVARGRAHRLRKDGLQADAEHHARLAEQIANDNGAVHRARWVREEFGLGHVLTSAVPLLAVAEASPHDPAAVDAERNERHIQALLGISRVNSTELDPEQQARSVLDEMIHAVRAERGYLLLRASGKGWPTMPTSLRDLTLIAGRNRSRMSIGEGAVVPARAIERVLAERQVVLLPPEGQQIGQSLALPLAVRDVVVGVVCLESPPGAGHFDLRDGEVLSALVGQVSFALELTRAVRDRERLAEDLQQAQKMEAVGRLAGGIAHDFNNMLAAICVSVEAVIAESPPTSSYRSDLETIQGAADRATRLTRQLLAFSRRQVFDARPLDLNDTVRDVVPMLQRLLGSNVELETELDPTLCVVKTDAAQLEQVLVNLAVNARDAMPHGGTLLLRTREVQLEPGQKPGLEAGAYAVLHVIDDGVGMDAETQRRIFEPFFSTKARDEGTGLGLSMVYGIVRQSSGHIELDSAVGMGTEFRVYLPKTNEVVATVAPPMPVTRSPGAAARVLLVDDEPLVRHAFRRALKRLGHNVIGAASAREAIQYLQQQPDVDLIITDVIMPGMNGLEMIERLQKLGIRSKVLYVSGYADGVLSRRAGLGDRIEFMQKPIQSEALAAKVQDLLQSKTLDRHA